MTLTYVSQLLHWFHLFLHCHPNYSLSFRRQDLDLCSQVYDLVFHGGKNICCLKASRYVVQKMMEASPSAYRPFINSSLYQRTINHLADPQVLYYQCHFLVWNEFFWSTSLCFVPHVYLLFSVCDKKGSPGNKHSAEQKHLTFCWPVWEAGSSALVQWTRGKAKLIFRKLRCIQAYQQLSVPQTGYYQKEIHKPN